MSLGENIYRLRTAKNLSQGDLADELEVSRQSVSKWETGGAVPDLDKLVKLAALFGVTLDELVTGEGTEEKPPEPVTRVIVERERRGLEGRQIMGIVLLALGILTALPIMLNAMSADGILGGLFLASPLLACGLICLLVRRHTRLWCAVAVIITLWLVLISLMVVISRPI